MAGHIRPTVPNPYLNEIKTNVGVKPYNNNESSCSENFDLGVFIFPNVAIPVTVKPSNGEHNQHGGHPPPTSRPFHLFRNRIHSITLIGKWQIV